MDVQLPAFDDFLINRQVQLTDRPFIATDMFIGMCLVNTPSYTKDEFRKSSWFKEFDVAITKWYAKRYAGAMNNTKDNFAPGVILIYGVPFELKIPLNTYQVEKPGETAWICFPHTVLPEENVCEWLISPPNLEDMKSKDITNVKKSIIKTAGAIRSIRINLLTASLNDSVVMRSQANSIPSHLHKSAKDILSWREAFPSIAFWEIHLAVEKTFKVFLRQRGKIPPKTHDITILAKLAEQTNELTIKHSLLESLPSHKEAIRSRYNENTHRTIKDAVLAYHTSLDIIETCTKALHRKIILNNVRFLFNTSTFK
ncbi:hypothetical protein MNBD_DELTA01-1815 [hydrothermal vent metagenome]|uniref:HEPN domain-containing protein n=1 Tax=hydrothermal vent metagenome TaxID=652676 RepID=A0A3B0RM52_9ZZZZ